MAEIWLNSSDADSSPTSDQQSAEGISQNDLDENSLEEEFDWSIEQTPFIERASPLDAPKYGFANQKSGVFQRLQVMYPKMHQCNISMIYFLHCLF